MKEKDRKQQNMRKADGKNTNGEKTEGKRKPRSVKKMFVISLFALAGLAAVIFFALVFSDAYTLTHPEKVSAKRFPDDSDIGLFYEAATVTFENGDKTVLWYIPAQDVKTAERKDSDITVIFSHDCGDNKTVSMIDDGILYAKQLVGEGINVVTFDYSGSGFATGKGYTFGAREKEELKQIIEYVRRNYPSEYTVLQGWGFGAAAAILAGTGNDAVTAVIADASYTDSGEYFKNDGGLEKWSSMPKWTHGLTSLLMPVLSDGDVFDQDPIDAVSEKTGQKYFFIGEGNDNVFPSEYAEKLNNAAVRAGNDSRVWISEKSYHAQAFRTDEKNYVNKILDFIGEVCK